MKHLLAAIALFTCASLVGAQEENPFKKAAVGDWADYKLDTTAQNIKLTGKMRIAVKAKTDDKATIRTTITINDQEVSAQETTIDLTKPFDYTSTTGLPGAAEAKVEKVGEPKIEKIKVAGKDVETVLSTLKLTATVMGNPFDSEIKVWTSKDLPLAGLAKMDVRSKVADMDITYTGSGNGK